MRIHTIFAAACAVVAIVRPAWAQDNLSKVTPKFEKAIPNIPGKSMVVVEVHYAPGAASKPHRHAKSAFIFAYVVSGEIESKVNGGEARICKAGETWSEPPGATNSVSRNTSKTKAAKLLAVFVVDSDDKILTTPVN
jgi:quercetin dioxygenase-like cupin family protein